MQKIRCLPSASSLRVAYQVSLLALSSVFTAVALAQESTSVLEEVVVTATKREQSVQDVGIAISAFSSEQIRALGVEKSFDIASFTPGVHISGSLAGQNTQFTIRGVTQNDFNDIVEAPTAVYLDDGYIAVAQAQTFAVFDVERVEVLKGPQGTLFGRNATGGAILYQMVKPTHEFGGYMTAGYGNFNNIEVNGAVNLPLGEYAALRLGASYHKRDGYQHNLALGGLASNQIDYQVYRASLLLDPIDGFESVTTFQYGTDKGRGSGLKLSSVNQRNPDGSQPLGPDGITRLNTTVADVYAQRAFSDLANSKAAGFYDFYNSESNDHKSRQYFVSNKTTYQISDSVKFTNILGYNDVKANDVIDVDGSGLPLIIIGNPVANGPTPGPAFPNTEGYHWTTRQWSNETQLSGKILNDKLNYIVGFYVSHVKTGTNTPTCAFCDIPFAGPGNGYGAQARFNAVRDGGSKAVFAQFTYKATDQLSLTGGYRHTWETQSITRLPDDTVNLGFDELKDNKPSWTVSLDFKPVPSLLLYVATRGSFRIAGYNVDNGGAPGVPGNNAYKTETTHDVEIGAKFSGEIGNIPSRVNIAVFNQNLKNAQRSVYLGISSVTGNVNKARIRGFEIDANFNLAKWMEVGGALSHTDAVYTDPNALAGGRAFVYGPYGDTPKWTGSAFAKVSHELAGNAGVISLRGEVYFQSSNYYSNLANSLTPNTLISSYKLFNLRAGWDDVLGSKLSLMAYAQNLTGKKYEVGGLDLGAVIGTSARLPGTPRTFGLQGTYKF
jgi:iron complex outermembrane recepter protein